jgi:BspA type Leucine rich repeat region (6 copies)/Fibronectin type III domain
LVQFPLAMTGNYVIPKNTTVISAYSFYHCNSLTALTLPINLTYIDDDAFRNCTSLSSVTMQGNVTHLGFQSFSNDSVLTSISFFGTVAASWVGYNWEIGDNAGLLGHALAASTFPAPGSYFYGLTMGAYLSSTPALPGAPTGLTAITMSGTIMLNWTAPSNPGSGVANYLVYRGTSAGGEGSTPIAKVLGTSYSDTGVTAGVPYYYTVGANNTVGVGVLSAEAHSSATSVTVPSAPQNFKVTGSTNQVVLQWTAPSSDGGSGIISYDVYRSDSGGAWTKITSVSASTLSYTDISAGDGSGHQYYVVAINALGKGTSTDIKSVASGSSGGSSSDNTGIFAVVGILAVVIVVAILFLFLKRRK